MLTVRKNRIIIVLSKGGDIMQTLKELRISSGLTQGELAKLFGVTPRTIQNMEKDSSNIKDSLLKKYIDAFGISYDNIFLGNEYENFVHLENKKKSVILTFESKQHKQLTS